MRFRGDRIVVFARTRCVRLVVRLASERSLETAPSFALRESVSLDLGVALSRFRFRAQPGHNGRESCRPSGRWRRAQDRASCATRRGRDRAGSGISRRSYDGPVARTVVHERREGWALSYFSAPASRVAAGPRWLGQDLTLKSMGVPRQERQTQNRKRPPAPTVLPPDHAHHSRTGSRAAPRGAGSREWPCSWKAAPFASSTGSLPRAN
jgi:hypothetical protein